MNAFSNYRRFVAPLLNSIVLMTLLGTSVCTEAAEKMNVRGKRYCEVIYTHTMTKYEIYNTFGLNDCPSAVWSKLTLEQIKKDTGSSFVHLNGPRYWVMDSLEHSSWLNATPKVLGGLSMRQAGVLNISLLEGMKARARSNPHYHKWRVERNTTWIYDAEKPVYELVAPDGTVFVMQSYCIQKQFQTAGSLSSLGNKLTLPAGWKFKTGTLHKPETLKAIDGVATVVQDNFLNTYQMATHDFLQGKS